MRVLKTIAFIYDAREDRVLAAINASPTTNRNTKAISSRINLEAEKLAVISARKAIERSEIALVMIDATEGVAAQDATVAGYAEEAGKAAMLVINKWDAEEHTQDDAKKFEDMVRFKLKFLAYAPLEFISAKSKGRRKN